MRRSASLTVAAALSGGALLLAAPAALAQTADYSGTGEEVLSTVQSRPGVAEVAEQSGVAGSPATLPFTGGEIVLISAAGAAAVAAGAALVVGGRRRSTAS
jgi:hypothetical protein